MTTSTLPDILAALPSTPVTVPDRPMVWRHTTSGLPLALGGVLTADQALAEAQAEHPGGSGFETFADALTWVTRYGTRIVYRAEHPAPVDWHDAASVLESDLLAKGVDDELAAALVHTVRTAIDGGDPAPGLRQFLAAWVRG